MPEPSMPATAGTPWLSPDEQQAWRAYMDGQQRLMATLNRQLLRDSDLSFAEYRILVLLSEAPGNALRMSELADGVLSSRSRLTHQIRGMEARDLVRRSSCPRDGRGVLAQLTETGMRTLHAAAPGHVAAVRRHFVDLLDPDELATVHRVFTRVDDTTAAPRP